MLDLRRSMMRPVGRVVPLGLHSYARRAQTAYRARGLERDDVVGASYPKSGSTWLRFLVADLAAEGAAVDFDNVKDLSAPLGAHQDAPRLIAGRGRFIKTHESYHAFGALPSRAVYVVRDGRDVAVSLFHFLRRIDVYSGPFDDYLHAFLTGRVVNYGAWQDHVLSWFAAAEDRPDDVAVLRYEDLLGPRAAEHLQQALSRIGWDVSVASAGAALERNSLQRMKEKESKAGPTSFARIKKGSTAAVPFVRAGRAGQWQELMTDGQQRHFAQVAGEALRVAGYVPDPPRPHGSAAEDGT